MSHGPRANSRKGLMWRCQSAAHSLFRDWRPHNGKWQPSEADIRIARKGIADLRQRLDEWEAKL